MATQKRHKKKTPFELIFKALESLVDYDIESVFRAKDSIIFVVYDEAKDTEITCKLQRKHLQITEKSANDLPPETGLSSLPEYPEGHVPRF